MMQASTQKQILDPLLKALDLVRQAHVASAPNEPGRKEISEASICLLVAIAKISPEWKKVLEAAMQKIQRDLDGSLRRDH